MAPISVRTLKHKLEKKSRNREKMKEFLFAQEEIEKCASKRGSLDERKHNFYWTELIRHGGLGFRITLGK